MTKFLNLILIFTLQVFGYFLWYKHPTVSLIDARRMSVALGVIFRFVVVFLNRFTFSSVSLYTVFRFKKLWPYSNSKL